MDEREKCWELPLPSLKKGNRIDAGIPVATERSNGSKFPGGRGDLGGAQAFKLQLKACLNSFLDTQLSKSPYPAFYLHDLR